MSGDKSETLPVRLQDRQRPSFERGQTNTFVISYPRGVGDINYVRIWHDNSGMSLQQFHRSTVSINSLNQNIS